MKFTIRIIWIVSLVTVLGFANFVQAWPKRPIRFYNFGRYTIPPRAYGYKLDEDSPGYYGGLRYKEYYNMGRGYGYADFPGRLPAYHGNLLPYRYWPYPSNEPRVARPNWHETCAEIIVHVPGDAQVWLENQATTQKGALRRFISPPLVPNQKYIYQVRARWQTAGGKKEQSHVVALKAGSRVSVQFPLQEPTEVVPRAPDLFTPPPEQPAMERLEFRTSK